MSLGTVDQWVVNAVDPPALARFWTFVLGGNAVERQDGWAYIEDASGLPRLSFQPTDERKRLANRIHLDVRVTDIAWATGEAVARGASTVGDVVTDSQGSFQILRDPEGNEFCLVTPEHA